VNSTSQARSSPDRHDGELDGRPPSRSRWLAAGPGFYERIADVFSVPSKDRGAILPGEQAGTVPILAVGSGIAPATVDREVHPDALADAVASRLGLSEPHCEPGRRLRELLAP